MEQAWGMKCLLDALFGLSYNSEDARTYVTHETSMEMVVHYKFGSYKFNNKILPIQV